MFGWGRKSDGFDWHTHVRTTIKLRREDRRARFLEAREVAADGIRYAGRASASAGSHGFASVWNGLLSAIQMLIEGADAGRRRVAVGAKRSIEMSAGAARGLIDSWGRRLSQSLLLPIFFAVGLVALHAAFTRISSTDRNARIELIITATVGLVCLAAALLPLLTGHARFPRFGTGRAGFALPAFGVSNWSVWHKRIAGGTAAAIVAAGSIYVAGKAAPVTFASLASFRPFSLPPVEGRASVLAGDVIRINTTTIRLAGIEAPENEQKCTNANKKKWACGEAARAALTRLVKGRKVRCDLSGTDEAGRALGSCDAIAGGASVNLAGALVKEGAVFANGGFFSSFSAFEADARDKKLGLWRGGDSERPSDYRARMWEIATKAAPDGCPIKGQVSGNEKSYVLPWHPDYSGVRIRTSKGERWFCSESEAQAAGWKVAGK